MADTPWPELPYDAWSDTYATLHMWTQIAGKIALAAGPPLNHSWGITLRVTPRGLATRLLALGERAFTIEFDFIDHAFVVRTTAGDQRALPLRPRTVADFYHDVRSLMRDLHLDVAIWPMPVEIPSPIRFDEDTVHRSYDPAWARRFWEVLVRVQRVFAMSRCPFIGKCSPVQFFWGSFDLAVTRFSGRPAPPRDGPRFMREAYSHEVISHGFWPGSGPFLQPAFYGYAVPEPPGLATSAIRPAAAFYHPEMHEFLLPYETVRVSGDPADQIREFIDSTYERGADLGGWNRAALERPQPA